MRKMLILTLSLMVSLTSFANHVELRRYYTSVCTQIDLSYQPHGHSNYVKKVKITQLLGSNNVRDHVANELTVEFLNGSTETAIRFLKERPETNFKNFALTLNYVGDTLPGSNVGSEVFDFQFFIKNGKVITQRLACSK